MKTELFLAQNVRKLHLFRTESVKKTLTDFNRVNSNNKKKYAKELVNVKKQLRALRTTFSKSLGLINLGNFDAIVVSAQTKETFTSRAIVEI